MIEKVSSTVKSIVPYEYRGALTALQRDDSLLKILKTEKSIDLEKINSINKDQILGLAQLLHKFKNIFCVDGDPVGTFKEYGRIPTIPGKTAARRQHPIP